MAVVEVQAQAKCVVGESTANRRGDGGGGGTGLGKRHRLGEYSKQERRWW